MSVSQTRMTVTKMHFVRTRLVRITAHVTQGMKVMESTAQISMNVLLAITLAIMMPPGKNTKGSFNCTCNNGFAGDGHNCTGKHDFLDQNSTISPRNRPANIYIPT